MTWFYYYVLTYYFDGEEKSAEGITCGETWAEVMSKLTEFYGEEEITEFLYLGVIDSDGGDCLEREFIEEVLEATHPRKYNKKNPERKIKKEMSTNNEGFY